MNPYIRELQELVDTMQAGLEKLPADSPYIETVKNNIEETMQEIDYLIEQDELAHARWQEQQAKASLADDPERLAEAVAWAYGEVPYREAKPPKYVKLSPNNHKDFEIRRGQKVRYYSNPRFYRKLSGLTRLVMFSGGMRVLRESN